MVRLWDARSDLVIYNQVNVLNMHIKKFTYNFWFISLIACMTTILYLKWYPVALLLFNTICLSVKYLCICVYVTLEWASYWSRFFLFCDIWQCSKKNCTRKIFLFFCSIVLIQNLYYMKSIAKNDWQSDNVSYRSAFSFLSQKKLIILFNDKITEEMEMAVAHFKKLYYC